jgi:hypothetical protein
MDTLVTQSPPAATSYPTSVQAELNYLAPGVARPVNYTFEPPAGVPWNTGVLAPQQVTIRNGRPLAAAGELSLDASGFQHLKHRSALVPEDFADDEKIRSIYYAEAEQVLLEATDAEKIVIFDHTVRDSEHGSRDRAVGLREPVRRIHNDQTFVSAPKRVLAHLPADEAERRLKGRFAIINLWRAITPVEQLPLALCDARSIEAAELIPSDLVYKHMVGETYSFLHNPEHRWYFFPHLQPDEPLLLKIYDSLTDGTARLTAHTAFDDPTSPTNAAPRRSIELRALVFWPEQNAAH